MYAVWGGFMVVCRKLVVYIMWGGDILDDSWSDVEWDMYAVWDWDILDSDWCDIERDMYIV